MLMVINITFSIDQTDSSDDSDKVSIDSDGEVTLNASADFENQDTYQFTVEATDGTDTVSKDVTVSVTDVDEAPIITNVSAHMNVPEVDYASIYATHGSVVGDVYVLDGNLLPFDR